MKTFWCIFLSCHFQVSQKEISFSFGVEQSLPVSDIKPVPVHIYDYYETGKWPNPAAGLSKTCDKGGTRRDPFSNSAGFDY